MNRWSLRVIGLWLFTLLSWGCSGPANVSEFYDQEIDAICTYEATCGFIGQSEKADCIAQGKTVSRAPESFSPLVSEKAGRLEIDRGKAGDCLTRLKQTRCDRPDDLFDPRICTDVFHGKQNKNDACSSSAECSHGVCGATSQTACGGTCFDYLDEGMICGNDVQCDPEKDLCNGSCNPLWTEGQACNFDAECVPGLTCVLGFCKKLLATELRCDPIVCGATERCVPSQTTADAGVCRTIPKAGGACPDLICPDGQVCAKGTCTPVLDLGAPCDATADACPADSICSDLDSTCHSTVPKEGDVCPDTVGACQPDPLAGFHLPLVCVRVNAQGSCQAAKLPGEACTASDVCADGCDSTTGVCFDAVHCL